MYNYGAHQSLLSGPMFLTTFKNTLQYLKLEFFHAKLWSLHCKSHTKTHHINTYLYRIVSVHSCIQVKQNSRMCIKEILLTTLLSNIGMVVPPPARNRSLTLTVLPVGSTWHTRISLNARPACGYINMKAYQQLNLNW